MHNMLYRSRYILRQFRPFVRFYHEEAFIIGSTPDSSSPVYQVKKNIFMYFIILFCNSCVSFSLSL